ncbi:hypothetical protein [Modestobacter sp. VKM Ac-2978]|uniref:hypothetical protein n=1 Tax=Modestobacter sp. VKM Ac-2978 TaxID=3004132 RepID=UPI0022AABB33|nr:hypothetical protein [Modestobacter sp. VKM Ac-2978]MCZ2847413.1 hypothetical protein [Modestobacter sp. VKM Ac-2978]
MQAALYFPYIAVPPSAWWTRTLLYWDLVGNIVPDSYIQSPDQLDPYTLDLVRAGLVRQLVPSEAGPALRHRFDRYLANLSSEDVRHRRRNFDRGDVVNIHADKWVTYQSGLEQVRELGLAGPAASRRGRWIAVETRTAADFMAALALALCQAQEEDRPNGVTPEFSWVPTTDEQEALLALLSGLLPAGNESWPYSRAMRRARADGRVAEIRSQLLEMVLPVPDEPLATTAILKFRERHGSLLPDLRRHIEERVDILARESDEDFRFRMLDRVIDEVNDQVTEAETYLREAGLRRLSRSSLLRVCKFIPGVGGYAGNTRELAESLQSNPDFRTKPLAYLAFARTTFRPIETFRVDPRTGMPLVEAMGAVPIGRLDA